MQETLRETKFFCGEEEEQEVMRDVSIQETKIVKPQCMRAGKQLHVQNDGKLGSHCKCATENSQSVPQSRGRRNSEISDTLCRPQPEDPTRYPNVNILNLDKLTTLAWIVYHMDHNSTQGSHRWPSRMFLFTSTTTATAGKFFLSPERESLPCASFHEPRFVWPNSTP